MRAISTAVLAALVLAAPAVAQKKDAKAPAGPQFKFSKAVQPLLATAQKAAQAGDNATALATLRQAEALPDRNSDDNYMIAMMKINAGIGLKDNALMEEAIEQALATGRVSAEDQPKFIRNLGALALQRNDNAKAITQFQRLVALNPNDTETLLSIAELQRRNGQNRESVATFEKAIAAGQAAGGKAEEKVYRRALAIAYDAKLPAETTRTSEMLVTSYPNPTNWRDALVIYRDSQRLDNDGNLDVLRLMRAAGALAGERDYVEFADTLTVRGFPGEAKSVLDEGVAKGAVVTTKAGTKEILASVTPKIASDRASLTGLEREARGAANGRSALATADANFGYGNYAKAAELYRLALQKGGVDANLANFRLGLALGRSGDAAGAKAAFAAVTTGPRAQLARFGSIWADQRAGGTTTAAAPAA
jgi:tetratricopeptide (TPR) repeat protein